MVGSAKKHLDDLLKLPADERSAVAEALLVSLKAEPDEDMAEVEAAWATEIERRIEENSVFAEIRVQNRS